MTEAYIEDLIFQISEKKDEPWVNGKAFNPDIQKVNDSLFHIIYDGNSYDVFVHKIDRENQEVELSINGKKTSVKLVSRIEKLLKELGMDHQLAKKLSDLKAPMPGMIHSIEVEIGQDVQKGDALLVLEAMKMENVIKAVGDGKVKNIHVAAKESVEKGHILISFE